MQAPSQEDLAPALKELVRRSVAILGRVIAHHVGTRTFNRIERIRRRMTKLRGRSTQRRHEELTRLLRELRSCPKRERKRIACSFTLMLELMNACENAYRTHRLRLRPPSKPSPRHRPEIVYVLTAHPSEARSPGNIAAFHLIQEVLVKMLTGSFETYEEELQYLLENAWSTETSPATRPSVEDEAHHLFSTLLRPGSLSTLLVANEEVAPMHLRTWVGGDKDGHPYVNEHTLSHSLQLSREHLLKGVAFAALPRDLSQALKGLLRIAPGDGLKVSKAQKLLERFAARARERSGAAPPEIQRLERLFKMFPALVIPLELRESAETIRSRGASSPISRMLTRLAAISRGGDPLGYARGLILSMASSADDVRTGIQLVRRTLGTGTFPVIPLFEQRKALEESPKTVAELLQDAAFRKQLRRDWNSNLEVMLGYSDSSKELGALKSRLLIARALRKIDRVVRNAGFKPVFFHGSGGSVDRGGGSVDEQTAWWPQSALSVFKATIQGEMVERTFASPEITRRQLERIAERARQGPAKTRNIPLGEKRAVLTFAERASRVYRDRISDPEFRKITEEATLYSYLDVLQIGSRPVARGRSLRAIPWVLCWTQTRILFPVWWGIGSAWRASSAPERRLLKRACSEDPLFRSYVKLLGFTVAKVELPIWRLYLENSGLSGKLIGKTYRAFDREYRSAREFVQALSGARNLLWFRPWLGKSIQLRSPMIHPLNLLQLIAMKEEDTLLLRTTVTGIASGMMTTG